MSLGCIFLAVSLGMINNHYEIEMNFGLENPNRVATISMCIPRSAYEILNHEEKLIQE